MKYDVIIVGAGSAGCALAARLSEDPGVSVLLLEAGQDYPDIERLPETLKDGYSRTAAQADSPWGWGYVGRASPRRTAPLMVQRGKVVGGSSAINGQRFLRGIPEDFDGFANSGNDQWSFLEVLPFFRKLETDADIHDDYHGTDGPVPVRRFKREEWPPYQEAFYQACVAEGFSEVGDMNHPEATGVGPNPVTNLNGIRISTALAYINPVRHRLNLTVKPNALAKRVLFEGRKATAVEVESGGDVFMAEGDEIVLCAGGIASPQLLMLSGVGPADHLRSLGIQVVCDLPGVGQNLRDHPLVMTTWGVRDCSQISSHAPDQHTILRYTANGSSARNDMQITPIWSADTTHGHSIPTSPIRLVCTLNQAMSSGELRLASTDPRVQPYLDYWYLEDVWDRERLRESVRLAVRISEYHAFRDAVGDRLSPTERELDTDAALDAWILENLDTNQHTSGTCKMGPGEDSMAVVDQYCRVRGLEGLRVVDLSVMPSVVRANTNATAIMIGERAAGWIRCFPLLHGSRPA